MITRLITKLIGDPNEKVIQRCRKTIEVVKKFEEEFTSFDEAQVKAKTQEFKERIKNGETLDQILPEAFALVKQACKLMRGSTVTVRGHELTWNMVPYDVQLIGGMILHEGKIAEMKTGEGKTLVATLPLYLNALEGKGAYLVTVNDYLAQRDAEWMSYLYEFLGLTVGVILHGQSPQEKKQAYACDITYGTNNEFGFDYLRDNMANSLEQCVQRELHYAIVDEVDSILIDEARTPLIISAPAGQSTDKYRRYAQLVTQLKQDEDYKIDEKGRSCILTDEGVTKMEELLGIDNIYTEAGAAEVHHIEQSLKAQALFQKDVDYMVREGEVVIIDEFTGRLMPGRRYSEGLHQAIEAKEGVKVKQESKTLATITFQNYFRLFKKLAGMTGTAITEAEEFSKIYSLETLVIPTNVPVQRKDLNDLIYKSVYGKFQAVTNKVKELQEKGQPVLVGTISVEKSEVLSKMFQQAGVKHEVLNAKHHEREAEIVADAGAKGAVTIATNMAGRGTDIKINDEVKAIGGLHIIGTERHESRRIDNQLRGRSGRQGDPGFSQFYVSMEDELMRLFGGDRMKGIMETLKVPEDMPIENRIISRSIESAQKRVEGHNFDIRKHLVEYDDVINKHRTIIYARRRKILENENIDDTVRELFMKSAAEIVTAATPSQYREEWQIEQLSEAIHSFTGADPITYAEHLKRQETERALEEFVVQFMMDAFETKKKNFGNDVVFFTIEKQVYLRTIDRLWMDHIDGMMRLREQVSFRGYAQKDPLVEYKNEGFSLFETLIKNIQVNTVQTLMRMEFKPIAPREEVIEMQTNEKEITDIETGSRELIPTHKTSSGRPTIISADDHSGHDPKIHQEVYGFAKPSSEANNVIRISADAQDSSPSTSEPPKVGRNDDCPCGSGKKYKKCHGK
ncbi:MAG: preprotein translocase subunit SecA [Candidatus Altimarinota bacterium]